MKSQLSQSERDRLRRIADLIDRESLSWSASFAVGSDDGLIWDDTDEYTKEAHARVIRLDSAAEFLRKISAK